MGLGVGFGVGFGVGLGVGFGVGLGVGAGVCGGTQSASVMRAKSELELQGEVTHLVHTLVAPSGQGHAKALRPPCT